MEAVLGIIPARSGSKGIPGKNKRYLAGRPLLAYTVEAARASGVIDRLILSTDSEEIAAMGSDLAVEVPFLRPPELALDETPMLPVLQHAVGYMESQGHHFGIIVLLQPTSPLRSPEHIQQAVAMLGTEKCDSVVSVIPIPQQYAPQKALKTVGGFLEFASPDGPEITRRQQLEPTYAREGTVYVFRRDLLMEGGTIYGDKCRPLILTYEESLNLDSIEDWRLAERRLGEATRA